MKTGIELIQAERARQVAVKGWSPEHDDGHKLCELADAAGCYLFQARSLVEYPTATVRVQSLPWPWNYEWWKPSQEPVRNLEKAGALYLAEMERLDRLGVNSAHVLLWVKQVAAEIDFLQGGEAAEGSRATKAKITNEMPDCPEVVCQCEVAVCMCGKSEKALRGWIAGINPPMTDEQREWCLVEISKVEGYIRKDFECSTDEYLARGVLSAWTDYCRDKGLI